MRVLTSFGWTLILLLFAANTIHAQSEVNPDRFYLKKLIQEDSIQVAEELIQRDIKYYSQQSKYDSLLRYIEIVGSPKLNHNNHQKALQRASDLVRNLDISKDDFIRKEALAELAWLQTEMGYSQEAYSSLTEALKIAEEIEDYSKSKLDRIEQSLGNNSFNLGQYKTSKKHYLKAIDLLKIKDSTDYESMQATFNALGRTMWMEAKMDSSGYYFEEALKTLSKTDKTDLKNHYYRPAMINSNLAIIKNALGKNTEAIAHTKESITRYGEYIQKVEDDNLAKQALKDQLASIDNLASFYSYVGEHKKGLDLLDYSYRKKQEIYAENDPNIIISLVLMAQSHISNIQYEKAVEKTAKALRFIQERNDISSYWEGSVYYTQAAAFENLDQKEKAFFAYQKAEDVLRQTMQGNYTKDFVDQMISMSLFYAKNGYDVKAENLAEEIYEFGRTGDFKNSLQNFYYIVNRAEVSLHLKDYKKAKDYSQKALLFSENIKGETSLMDSIVFDYRRPKALWVHAQAAYHLLDSYDEKNLAEIYAKLKPAFTILQQRKKLIYSDEDISLLMNENASLYEFAKIIQLQLYELTNKESYLEELIGLHEEELYTRIRTHLNLQKELKFLEVPEKVLKRERYLKENFSKTLTDQPEDLQDYFQVQKEWESHVDSLKRFYPKYYKIRYAKRNTDLDKTLEKLAENSTLIRYLFVEDQLYALLLSTDQKRLFKLDSKTLEEDVQKVNKERFEKVEFNESIVSLYENIWKPFADEIHTERVVIIPDKTLFNLSFEVLSPEAYGFDNNWKNNNLLNRHVLSYNFSFHGIGVDSNDFIYTDDFVAFAPGFTENMKVNYLQQIRDSLEIDKNYLTLLPQPFSAELTQRFVRIFKGNHFLNENATKQIFTQSAGNHKIIHISTHAESNNINPELSRLIFAKSTESGGWSKDNYLHSYEIYNTNLNSKLAVLTACETGKPTHRPGEGMISLAHAFNYAGSESILTSLWKIDEEASIFIIDHFYRNLAKGMDKDYALREAKIRYLENAKGRSVMPQYWAGIVLMGDVTSIELRKTSSYVWIWESLLIFLFLAVLIFFYRNKIRQKD